MEIDGLYSFSAQFIVARMHTAQRISSVAANSAELWWLFISIYGLQSSMQSSWSDILQTCQSSQDLGRFFFKGKLIGAFSTQSGAQVDFILDSTFVFARLYFFKQLSLILINRRIKDLFYQNENSKWNVGLNAFLFNNN